jgi:dolichol-phosphate mannosyltransferase
MRDRMSDHAQYIRALKGPIIVAGASGFIGANLYYQLSEQRSDVYALVQRERNWRLRDVDANQILTVNLNDYASTKNLLNTIKPQTIFNCVAYGAYSFEKDVSLIYQTNFQSIVNLVESLEHLGSFSAFVSAGSSSEYGTNCSAPKEDAPCSPNSHYSVSKLALADYLSYIGKHRSFPAVNLRLYSVYGPLEDTSRLIPNLLRKALAGDLPSFVDPRTSRDFVHVDDVCAAFILAAAKMNPELFGETFNIGSGIKTTISDLAQLTRSLFAISAVPQFGAMEGREWDLAEWYSDSRKAGRLLGWRAEKSLSDGLSSTSEWVATLSENDHASSTKLNAKDRPRSVTAIIACYKDEQAIPIMYRRLTGIFLKLGVDYEIIFVNDCSPDGCAEVIKDISAKDHRVLGITHSRNFGSQMAFRSGMELSTKDSVVLLDGDLQDPPELIEQFYENWRQGWDVVYGRRIKREMPFFWGLMYKLFYRVFAAFSYIKIPHDAGDFSLIDKRVVAWLLNCPERDLFLRGLRAYIGFNQIGVDYIRPKRMFGVSTNNLLKNIGWAKKGIFSFSDTPLNLLTAAGVACLGLSILAALILAVLRLLFPDIAPKGITTIIIITIFFGSLNLFAIGVIGEYVSKIMFEVKGRPRLIRASLIRNGQVVNVRPDLPKNNT